MNPTVAAKFNKSILLRNTAMSRLKETLREGEGELDESRKAIFLARALQVDTNYKEFQEYHNYIIGLVKDEDFPEHDKIRSDTDIIFYKIKALCAIINKSHIHTENSNAKTIQKLPKIQIPKFAGDIKEWPAFIDLFNSLVHNNDSISKIEKFHHLITSVRDEAHNIIKGLPLVEINYDTAYQILKNRYENKRLLATAYYQQLQNATALQRPNSKDLRLLLDTFHENIESLKVLNFPVNSWDFLLFNMLLQKLDTKTRTDFELEHSEIELPSYKQLITFLENQSKALDSLQLMSPKSKMAAASPTPQTIKRGYQISNLLNTDATNTSQTQSSTRNTLKCSHCSGPHGIYKCTEFLSRPVQDRIQIASTKKLCKNCLSSLHNTFHCKSTARCHVCDRRHHTLLHLNAKVLSVPSEDTVIPSTSSESVSANEITQTQSLSVMTNITSNYQISTVLLSTAVVNVKDIRGNYQPVRLLIDSGSMINFISDNCVNRLGLKPKRSSLTIHGLNNMSTQCSKGSVLCHMQPAHGQNPKFNFEALIVPQICSKQPQMEIDVSNCKHITNLCLADPKFHIPSSIDILIGAELTPYIFNKDRIFGTADQPVAIDSIFGWILQGSASVLRNSIDNATPFSFHVFAQISLNRTLQKFWEVEQVPKSTVILTPEEQLCETIFSNTVKREPSGRFIVSLPFKASQPVLGDSYSQAKRRFLSLENKLAKNPSLRIAYAEFMKDYLESGHMSVPSS
ncbi:hypothetical protein PPYR_05751 [Photinus pyralis]|uniref:Uncharacterized protein n=1 Tax=Photinus pyralis TaxID=7054 RepID=A0A5N4AVP9_PHOPY|nr:uncharacterized protein LOC116165833 [Photinus pyralis]KAB0801397.1 hypothetical protein PPYR_05751 [Photinus pyralis]